MNTTSQATGAFPKGFSFIEVLLSLTLVASALVTIMALIPAGLKASRNATNSVIMAHILEDAHERLEGHTLTDGPLESEPFYYDEEGIFLTPIEDALSQSSRLARRLYRVDIRLVSPKNDNLRQHAPDLKAVILTVSWPVNLDTGEVPGDQYSSNRKSITYYVNTLTGPGWSEIDSDFEPLIEF